MYLVNGIASTNIEVADRGFQYGDGLFETIAIHHQQTVFLKQHLQRLQSGCQHLLIPIPDINLLVTEIVELCQSAPAIGFAVLKLIITRGVGGRGYRQPEPIQPSRVLSLHPFPEYSDSYQLQGVVTRLCKTRLGISPALAGVKHLNRLEQVLARAEWSDVAIQEGIMLNVAGNVIEGTMSNVFYGKNNILYTASLKQSGVAGVMRQIVIELCSQHHIPFIEHDYTQADLFTADEVFLTNAIIGIWPVRQIEDCQFPMGALTRQIQLWLTEFKAAGIGFEV